MRRLCEAMHVVMIQGSFNRPPERLFDLVMAHADMTVITEHSATHTYHDSVAVHRVAETRDIAAVRDALVEIMRTRRVDRLFTPFERHQSLGGYLRELFDLPGRDFRTGLNFSSKLAMKRGYRAGGIPTSDFAVAYHLDRVSEAANRVGWPVVIKPILGGGSTNVVSFGEPADFKHFVDTDPRAKSLAASRLPILVEKLVEMTAEYHCDGVVLGGQVRFAAASVYLEPLMVCRPERNGSTLLPKSHPDSVAIAGLHARAVEVLGLQDGVTHMELFKTPNGWLCGEIAARVAGGGIADAIFMRHGIDLWQIDVEIASGLTPVLDCGDEADDFLVNLLLPTRVGRVEEISSATDFADLPGVRRVDMSLQVGETVAETMHSSSSSGIVYLTVQTEAEIEPAVQAVIDCFKLRVIAPGGDDA